MTPGPIRVVRVDVDAPLPELSPTRGDGVPYVGVWVFALRNGLPLGHVEIDFADRPISPADVRAALVDGLGNIWPAPLAAAQVPDSRLPAITIVVPTTFDRWDRLQRCVATLTSQNYPTFDVIVVDNRPNSSPERARWWRQLSADAQVSVIAQPRPGSSAARNQGVAAATGEIVVFTDDDVEVEPGWLRAIGRRFAEEPETDCVTGLVLPIALETPAQIWFETSGSKIDQRYEKITFRNDGAWRRQFLGALRFGRFEVTGRRESGAETIPVYRGKFGMAANISLRVDAFRALGGFDEALGAGIPSGGGEELHLISRLVFSGRQLTFDPSIAIYHAHRSDYDDLRRRMVGYGSGYTAMLFALVCRDLRHVAGLAGYALRVAGLLLRRSEARGASDYPRELARAELRGLLTGPWTYLVSRRHMRRFPAAPIPAATTEATLAEVTH